MINRLENLFFETDIDISSSRILQTESTLTIQSKIGTLRLLASLFFALPCFFFAYSAFTVAKPITIAGAVLFCPILLLLAILFGCVIQKKSFDRKTAEATKSYLLFGFSKRKVVSLPRHGEIRTSKEWSSSGEGPGCWIYHVSIEGLNGFGFSIAKEKEQMDEFVFKLAGFLGYKTVSELEVIAVINQLSTEKETSRSLK